MYDHIHSGTEHGTRAWPPSGRRETVRTVLVFSICASFRRHGYERAAINCFVSYLMWSLLVVLVLLLSQWPPLTTLLLNVFCSQSLQFSTNARIVFIYQILIFFLKIKCLNENVVSIIKPLLFNLFIFTV